MGRWLKEKNALVVGGAAPISDCVLRLRVPAEFGGRPLEALISAAGPRQLTRHAHGTGARHISAASLLQLEV